MQQFFLQVISAVVGTTILSLFGLTGSHPRQIVISKKSHPRKQKTVAISSIFVAVVVLATLAIVSPQ